VEFLAVVLPVAFVIIVLVAIAVSAIKHAIARRSGAGLDRRPRAHVPFLRRRAEAAGSRQSEERGCSFV